MMKWLIKHLHWVSFILVIGFFIFNWSYVIYPVFVSQGTLGNSALLLVVALVSAWCVKQSVINFYTVQRLQKIIFLLLVPVCLIVSLFLGAWTSNLFFWDWLKFFTNWQINIYYFDSGMFVIFLASGISFLSLFIASVSVRYFITKRG